MKRFDAVIVGARCAGAATALLLARAGARTVEIEPRYGVDALYAPRRQLLDRVLVDVAAASGVEVEYGVRVVDLIRNGERVTNTCSSCIAP